MDGESVTQARTPSPDHVSPEEQSSPPTPYAYVGTAIPKLFFGGNDIKPNTPPPDHVSPEEQRAPAVPCDTVTPSGTVIPNRIFVGGIDFKTTERDIRHFFSQYGVVMEVNIIVDRLGMSKGYGFVTFESQEEVQRILHNSERMFYRNKKINIGLAIRRPHAAGRHSNSWPQLIPKPSLTLPPCPTPCSITHLTTANGSPYTYYNGMAYFHSQHVSPPTHPFAPVPSTPVVISHPQQPPPVYQQAACGHYESAPNHFQWNILQTQVASNPVGYWQQTSEQHIYPVVEQPSNGGCMQQLPGTPTPEFAEHVGPPAYNQGYAQSPAMWSVVLPEHGKHQEHTFHGMRQRYPQSPIYPKPRYGRSAHRRNVLSMDSISRAPEDLSVTQSP